MPRDIHLYRNIAILKYSNMGATKSEFFTPEQNTMAQMLKALGHPARIAIVEFLLKAESCICGDIVNELPLAQPTVSQHLKELKNSGIIKGNIEGNAICYCIDREAIGKMAQYFEDIAGKLKNDNINCC